MPTLLIVEDELVLARNLSKALIRNGFEVHQAGTIAEAKTTLAAATTDVALIDLRRGQILV